jgi:hypothetical protein
MQGKSGKPVAPAPCTFGTDDYWEKLEPDTEFVISILEA